MISPYSIIFISPLRCGNRWPACPVLITLSPSSRALLFSFSHLTSNSRTLIVKRWKNSNAKVRSTRTPCSDRCKILFFEDLLLGLMERARESGHVRASHLSDSGRRRRKENRCRTYHLFHMYPAAHLTSSASRWLAWRHLSFTWSRIVVQPWCVVAVAVAAAAQLLLWYSPSSLKPFVEENRAGPYLNICSSINQYVHTLMLVPTLTTSRAKCLAR